MTTRPNDYATQNCTTYPLAYNQQGLWYLYQLAPEMDAYNTSWGLRLCCELNVTALQRALQALADRHAVLRTTFIMQNGQPMQVVHGAQPVDFAQVDVSTLTWAEVKVQARAAHNQPFDLARGPLFRVRLFTQRTDHHLLLPMTHHIVIDLLSWWKLFDELRVLYTALTTDVTPTLPPATDYGAFVTWQGEMLAGKTGARLWAYWRDHLAGDLPLLNLPTDYTRPAVKTYHGASVKFYLDEPLVAGLRQVAVAHNVTMYMLLLAAYFVFLHRYTGQTDLLVGSTAAGRTQRAHADVVGPFADLIIVRAELAGNPTFIALLQQVGRRALQAVVHQGYPFLLLVERLGVKRDRAYSPLFQTLFSLERPPRELARMFIEDESNAETRVVWGDWLLAPLEMGQQEGHYDLSLDMYDDGAALFGFFRYNTDLFAAETVQHMAQQFQTLLTGIVADPTHPIGHFPLLTTAGREQLLSVQHSPSTDTDQTPCIHYLFEAQAARMPDAVAVVASHTTFATGEEIARSRDYEIACMDTQSPNLPISQSLTYRTLNEQANRLAHELIRRGVGPEVLVGLCVERSPLALVGMLAILKAGGAFLPLDPNTPGERLAYLLADSGTLLLLTQRALLPQLQGYGVPCLCLDADVGRPLTENPHGAVTPADLAYVIYTSGSTGQPKGVMVEHGALAAHCLAVQTVRQLTPADRVLQFYAFQFDAALEQIFPTLLAGATVVLSPTNPTIEAFSQLIRERDLTVLDLPTAYWALAVQRWAADRALLTDHQVQLVFVGGDVLPVAALSLWQQTPLKDVPLFNAYGPTEAAITATCFAIPRDFDRRRARIPIGCPLPHKTIYLLDADQQPVPTGVPGEIWIGGAIARGYLNRPELTDFRFWREPIGRDFSLHTGYTADNLKSKIQNLKSYRTGDWARRLPDGTLEFLGRMDQQIKLRGYRIELEEIEAVLKQQPALRDAAVVQVEQKGNPTGGADPILAAFVVARTEPIDLGAIQDFLRERLPTYMIPAFFVWVEALPLTAGGKVDRRTLAARAQSEKATRSDTPPGTLTETRLAAIWQELLGVERVSRHDTFIELGGHSLLVPQLIQRIHATFAVALPVQSLFEFQSLAALAGQIERIQSGKSPRGVI